MERVQGYMSGNLVEEIGDMEGESEVGKLSEESDTLVKKLKHSPLGLTTTISGWIGKPKLELQTLWEIGSINNSDVDSYTMYENYRVNLIVNTELSLSINMDELDYFAREISQLQLVGQKLGGEVYPTPKCHADIEGG